MSRTFPCMGEPRNARHRIVDEAKPPWSRQRLLDEAALLAEDPGDRAEAAALIALLEALRAPWTTTEASSDRSMSQASRSRPGRS